MSMQKFKAVNAFIFAGSFSLGTMRAGFNLEKVLEISDDILQKNCFYWKKNHPEIPVVLPSEWENDQYLLKLHDEGIDLMCCNCPCSGLSRINLNASADQPQNIHFYRLFNIMKNVQPKTFVIENAPTLVNIGYPIIKDLVKELGDIYRFSIVHDQAGNHNVALKRQRTMIVGWRRDVFEQIPLINPDKHPQLTSGEIMKEPVKCKQVKVNDYKFNDITDLFKYGKPNRSIMESLADRVIANEPCKDEIIRRVKEQGLTHALEHTMNGIIKHIGYFDKTPWRPAPDHCFKAFATPQFHLHPFENRTLTANEMGRVMGYPDDWDWSDDANECLIPVRTAICQGVPANFGQWICENVKNALEKKCSYVTSGDVVFQSNLHMIISEFTKDEIQELSKLEDKKSGTAWKLNEDLTLTPLKKK